VSRVPRSTSRKLIDGGGSGVTLRRLYHLISEAVGRPVLPPRSASPNQQEAPPRHTAPLAPSLAAMEMTDATFDNSPITRGKLDLWL
jgi:hypothetical protein